MTLKAPFGFRFRDGKLIVSSEDATSVVHAWPDLRAVRKPTDQRSWSEFTPLFRLLRPNGAAGNDLGPTPVQSGSVDPNWQKALAFANFRYSIPTEVAKTVEEFPARQWTLLATCRKGKRSAELLTQAPAVGFSLAHAGHFRPTCSDPDDVAARLCGYKQREILGWLGFPDSQSWVNILVKIAPRFVGLDQLLSLRSAAKSSGVEKLLCHLRAINSVALTVVANERLLGIVSPSLLTELADCEEVAQAAIQQIEDIVRLAARMNRPPPIPCRSMRELEKRHAELVDQYAKFDAMRKLREQLPDPPIPGTARIIPIVNTTQLAEEGLSQHNCVASYADDVRKGDVYIYSVLAPERATLSIIKGPDGNWEIQQLRLSYNRSVGDATRTVVTQWLGGYSSSV